AVSRRQLRRSGLVGNDRACGRERDRQALSRAAARGPRPCAARSRRRAHAGHAHGRHDAGRLPQRRVPHRLLARRPSRRLPAASRAGLVAPDVRRLRELGAGRRTRGAAGDGHRAAGVPAGEPAVVGATARGADGAPAAAARRLRRARLDGAAGAHVPIPRGGAPRGRFPRALPLSPAADVAGSASRAAAVGVEPGSSDGAHSAAKPRSIGIASQIYAVLPAVAFAIGGVALAAWQPAEAGAETLYLTLVGGCVLVGAALLAG